MAFFAIFRLCGKVDLSEQRNLSSLSAEIRMMELEKEVFFLLLIVNPMIC